MTGTFGVGAVLHWTEFPFDDGASANKFFVVLGAKQGHDCLLVIATSRPKNKSYQPGCHREEGYYHIQGGRRDFFPDDTWLLLMECKIFRPGDMVRGGLEGQIKVVDQLREQVANAIRNCLRQIDDVSPAQLVLL